MSLSTNGLGKTDTVYRLADDLPLTCAGNDLALQSRIMIKDKLKYQGYMGIDYFNDYELIINSTENEYLLLNPEESFSPEVEHSNGMVIYLVDDIWKIIQIDSYDPALSNLKLLDEVTMLDHLPINRFESICDYREYLRQKIDKKESLFISTKDSLSLELPYRRNKVEEIPTNSKK